jgi:hypothetical protein
MWRRNKWKKAEKSRALWLFLISSRSYNMKYY